MSTPWKKTVATGAILVVATLGGPHVSEAAGRISERLTTARANSAKERPTAQSAEDDDKSGSGRLGKRASSSSRLASRPAKRKEVPPHAQEALNSTDGLEIDLGDMVETLDTSEGPTLTPPSVPPTGDREVSIGPGKNANSRPNGDPHEGRRASRRAASVLASGGRQPVEP